MNWVLGLILIAALIIVLIQQIKLRRLINSLKNTNESLNETRALVAKHEKIIKRYLK
jgi:hypothetical protein